MARPILSLCRLGASIPHLHLVEPLRTFPIELFQSKRSFSNGKGFIDKLMDSIKDEISKNKELNENLRKLKEEAEKLEHSDSLQKARAKYQNVEAETSRSSEQLKEKYNELYKQMQQMISDVGKSEVGKKSAQISSDLLDKLAEGAKLLERSGETLGKSSAIKALSEGAKSLKQEIDEIVLSRAHMYIPPETLRKRSDRSHSTSAKVFEANTEAMGVELHKDSRWYQSWKSFSENNQYVNKLWDWKMKYDESDNPFLRTTRFFTDKLSDVFGGLFSKTEMSEVLTEICKIDPTFDKEKFILECQRDIIPNILEAIIRADLEVLKDWCHEVPFKQLSEPIRRCKELGHHYDSKILDLDNVEIAMGKMMEQGPVLIITFQTTQIESVRDIKGNVVEGDPASPLKVNYVWVLCRDQEELDPKAAWKLLEMHASSQKQWL